MTSLLTNSVTSVLKEFLDLHRQIVSVSYFSPLPTVLIQERVVDEPSSMVIAKALDLRNHIGLPFWECANLCSFETGGASRSLISEALFHNGADVSKWQKNCCWITEENVDALSKSLEERILVLSSRVELESGAAGHIPMLDFHCPLSRNNTRLVETCVRELRVGGGWIVSSGKSYHFYGKQLLTPPELTTFLARALLLAPITDKSWIAHQLIEGACGLRVSKRRSDANPPQVLSEI